MSIFSQNQKISLLIIFFISFFNVILTIDVDEAKINSTETPFKKDYSLATEEKCISFSVELSDEQKGKLKEPYLHFSMEPKNIGDTNSQQLIYSSTESCPSVSNAEYYSLKPSRNSNLFFSYNNIAKFHLKVKCLNYPCEFTLYAGIENEYVVMKNDESNHHFSYYSKGNKINTLNFKIPSSLKKDTPDTEKHVLTISITNPDTDYIQLYSFTDSKNKMNTDSIKTPTGIIFTFIENNNMKDKFYILEIQSLENQFISFTVKTSIMNEKALESHILPNYYSYYSLLNTNNVGSNEECFVINEEYAKENILTNNEDLLYASITYYDSIIKPYLKYNNEYKLPEEWNANKNIINIILKKNSDIIPKLCFKTENIKNIPLMIEISHINKKNKNADVYNPLSSGFIHQKTLGKNDLALFTHNSDIHYIVRLSFFVKVLQGNPEVFIVSCDDYPNCYNDVSQLRKADKNVIKPTIKDNQFYSYSLNLQREKDLSPYGPKQHLLYVFCPDEAANDYCKFEAYIYSDLDQIIFSPLHPFYSNLLKDESDLYKISVPKNIQDFKRIEISINSQQNLELEIDEEDMKCEHIIKNGGQIHDIIPNTTNKNGFSFEFNIKANETSNYNIKYKIIKLDPLSFGKIEELKSISFPLTFYYILPNKKQDFKDLLFNFNFINSKKEEKPIKTSSFKKIYINSTIINTDKLNEIMSNNDNGIFNENPLWAKKEFDLLTKSINLDINKENIGKIPDWIKDDDELLLYVSIFDSNNLKDDKNKLDGKLFLFYENKTDFIIPPNNFINGKLSTNKIDFKLYHLQLENENKTTFMVDFSSNYELIEQNDTFKISFIDYNDNIDNIKLENLTSNSTNINFINSTNNSYANNHFEFTLEDGKKDVLLCIYSDVNDTNLSSINYIFKYNTYVSDKDYEERPIYTVDKNINYSVSSDEKKLIIEFDNIIKNKGITAENCKKEIYLRKILQNKLLENEKIETIAKIETEYQLIDGAIEYKDKKVKITSDYGTETNYNYFSVFIDLPEENEKYISNTLYINYTKKKEIEPDPGKDVKPGESKGLSKTALVLIIVSSVLVVIIIIIVLLVIKTRRKHQNLENNIINISFKDNRQEGIINDNEDGN